MAYYCVLFNGWPWCGFFWGYSFLTRWSVYPGVSSLAFNSSIGDKTWKGLFHLCSKKCFLMHFYIGARLCVHWLKSILSLEVMRLYMLHACVCVHNKEPALPNFSLVDYTLFNKTCLEVALILIRAMGRTWTHVSLVDLCQFFFKKTLLCFSVTLPVWGW